MKKKRIVNEILLSKVWYIGQIYTISKFIKEEIGKDNSSTLYLKVWTTYFRHRYSIKLSLTQASLFVKKDLIQIILLFSHFKLSFVVFII